ncbi:hypothetical protein [Peribacillus sp. SCS-155]|uniref:hypothetical protein n=1 Tax=Peribacillus sedimenti TaxID=3115297 RepID=UPI003905D278
MNDKNREAFTTNDESDTVQGVNRLTKHIVSAVKETFGEDHQQPEGKDNNQ